MAGNGSVILDVGASPGMSDIEFTITGLTGIADASKVDAWVIPAATTLGWGCDAFPFNGGTGAAFALAGTLSVANDASQGICSFWASLATLATTGGILSSTSSITGDKFQTLIAATTAFEVKGIGSIGGVLFDFLSNSAATGEAAKNTSMHHVLCAWDNANNIGSMYIDDILVQNGISRGVVGSLTISSMDTWVLGGDALGSVITGGLIGEVYLTTGAYLDLSVTSNRRKFNQYVGTKLAPVFLGTNGSLPTGTAALAYFHLDNGEVPTNFGINRGSGSGPFTWNGIAADIPGIGIPLLAAGSGHSIDEHVLDGPEVKAYSPSAAGASMKVRLSSRKSPVLRELDYLSGPSGLIIPPSNMPLINGKWNIGWAWA